MSQRAEVMIYGALLRSLCDPEFSVPSE